MAWTRPRRHRVLESLAAVEREMGWPLGTLKDWKNRGWIASRRDGKWDTRGIWRRYEMEAKRGRLAATRHQQRQVDASELEEQIKRATLDVRRETAREKRRKNDLEEGRMLYAESVAESAARVVGIVRGRLDQFPEWLATRLQLREDQMVVARRELESIMEVVDELVGAVTVRTAADVYGSQELVIDEEDEDL